MALDNSGKEQSKRAVLLLPNKLGKTEVVKLRRDATIIGRDKGDILIDDTEISSTHCQIQQVSGHFHLFDMNSTNGTFLNDQRIVKAKLSHGDEIRIGKTSLTFEIRDESRVRNVSTFYKPAREETSLSNVSVVEALEQRERRGRQPQLNLEITYGDGSKESVLLEQKVVYLGRATSFGKFDQDVEISRRHVMIKLNDSGDIFVEDQSSTNGSYLNGQRITGLHQISSEDELVIGACRVKIMIRMR